MEIFIIIWLGFAILTGVIANSKGKAWPQWFIVGLLFGVFATVAIATRSTEIQRPHRSLKTCPACDEKISAKATICPHCRTPQESKQPQKRVNQIPRWVMGRGARSEWKPIRWASDGRAFCANCDGRLYVGETHCPKCKRKLEEAV